MSVHFGATSKYAGHWQFLGRQLQFVGEAHLWFLKCGPRAAGCYRRKVSKSRTIKDWLDFRQNEIGLAGARTTHGINNVPM